MTAIVYNSATEKHAAWKQMLQMRREWEARMENKHKQVETLG